MWTKPSSLASCSLEIPIILPPNSSNPAAGMCAILLFVMICYGIPTDGTNCVRAFSLPRASCSRDYPDFSCQGVPWENQLGHDRGISAVWCLMDPKHLAKKWTNGQLVPRTAVKIGLLWDSGGEEGTRALSWVAARGLQTSCRSVREWLRLKSSGSHLVPLLPAQAGPPRADHPGPWLYLEKEHRLSIAGLWLISLWWLQTQQSSLEHLPPPVTILHNLQYTFCR